MKQWKIYEFLNRRLLIACLIIVMVVLSVTSLIQTFSIRTSLDQYLRRQEEERAGALDSKNGYQEDGFLIAGTYEIKSTKAISDAYLKQDPSKLSDQDRKTYDMAAKILEEVIKEGMTPYEKELAVYDWLTRHVDIGESTLLQTYNAAAQESANQMQAEPYGVLLRRHAVCVGYATTFRLFMNMLGMDCHIVHTNDHSWDLVKLDDGNWYHVDAYSDSDSQAHNCFNMTDDMCRSQGFWEINQALPEAKGIKYTYAMQNCVDKKDIYQIPGDLKKTIKESKTQSRFYRIPFSTLDIEDNVSLMNTMFNTMLSRNDLGLDHPQDRSIETYVLPVDDHSSIVCVYMNCYGEHVEEAPEGDIKAMCDAFNKAFGTKMNKDNYSE